MKRFRDKSKRIGAVLLFLVVPLTVDFVMHMRYEARVREEIGLVNEMHGWVLSFADVDAIEVNHGGAIQRFSAGNYVGFDALKSSLNPLARAVISDGRIYGSGISGSQLVNINRLEWAAAISYFIGDDKLFEADIYTASDEMDLPGVDDRTFSFNGQRAVVVLDASGWFGAFYEDAEVYF